MEIHPFIIKWQTANQNFLMNNEWIIHKNENNEVEYFGFIPEGAKYLIIGTFPAFKAVNGAKSKDYIYDFFYGSIDSLFWAYTNEVFRPVPEIATEVDIFKFLRANKIAITDILYQIERVDENRRSSLDKDLEPIKYNGIDKLLKDYPDITHIIFTSGTISGRLSRGKSAAGWSSLRLKELLPNGRLSFSYDNGNHYFVTTLKNLQDSRKLILAFLYSPSDGSWAATEGTVNKAKRNFAKKNLNFDVAMISAHQGITKEYSEGDLLKLLQWKVIFSQLGFLPNYIIDHKIIDCVWERM